MNPCYRELWGYYSGNETLWRREWSLKGEEEARTDGVVIRHWGCSLLGFLSHHLHQLKKTHIAQLRMSFSIRLTLVPTVDSHR